MTDIVWFYVKPVFMSQKTKNKQTTTTTVTLVEIVTDNILNLYICLFGGYLPTNSRNVGDLPTSV